MKQFFSGNWLFLRFCVAVLTVSVVVLPLTPVISAAAEPKAVSKKVEKVDTSKAVVLDDTKKTAASNPQEVGGEKLTPEQTNNMSVTKTENIPPKIPVQAQPAQQPEEGLSTLAKVGIGVGAVAVVGGVVALVGGSGGSSSGSSSGGSSSLTAAKVVGLYNCSARNDEYGLSFYGVFNFYEVGSFTYDYDVSDGVHEQGTGSWVLEGNRLTTMSDHQSSFIGDFQGGSTSTITMHHAQLQWVLTLNKQ